MSITTCVACEGTGISSKGWRCEPCAGTGEQNGKEKKETGISLNNDRSGRILPGQSTDRREMVQGISAPIFFDPWWDLP